MITIKNTQSIIGEICLGRRIWNVTEEVNRLGDHAYAFHFGHDGDGLEFNKPLEVRLRRDAIEDRYYLFVMGLEMLTGLYISQENIRDKEALLDRITRVMSKAKHWWETK